jgi:maltose alpha-D-glucosyltransferase/alpha-amylase
MMSEHVEADDVFTWLRDALRDSFGGSIRLGENLAEGSRSLASDLGEATAALHEALTGGHPGPWHPEPFTEEDFRDAFKSATRSLGAALRRLALLGHAEEPTVAESARRARAQLLDLRAPIERTLRHLEGNVGGVKGVIHSDLHLAQVLRRRTDAELLFIDFEGEPDRPPSERGRKLPPLRDVGSMVRSFAYVRHFVIRDLATDASMGGPDPKRGTPSDLGKVAKDGLIAWEAEMVGAFTGAYLSRSKLHPGLDETEARRLIQGWAMEKALYELEYELKHRISNVSIPLDGIVDLAASSGAVEG